MKFKSKQKDIPQPQTPQPFRIIEGALMCHECGEYVDQARYMYVIGVLAWVCSQGHKSYIEDYTD